jgi:sn-glycerol 3-phosphate transport system substrate-binding protein
MKDYVTKTPQVAVARDQLQYAQNELGTHNMAEVQTILSNAIQAGVTGQSDAKTALDDAQSKAEKILSAYSN